MRDTRQVNLRLSPEHAELARLFVQRLREGGPSFEREIRHFLLGPYSPHYMTISELDRRFGEILRRLEVLEAEIGTASSQQRSRGQPSEPAQPSGREAKLGGQSGREAKG